MQNIYRQIPLYRFLIHTNQSELPKTILDCGAGGTMPPLGLFYEHGYETHGIEYSQEQIHLAKEFQNKNHMELHIEKGDMRSLPFKDEQFSFVYSYNAVFHMTKDEVKQSILEMKRVLKPNGLFFVNFLSTEDFRFGNGKNCSKNQFLQMEDGEEIMHSYYEIKEADELFLDMKQIYKETRVFERMFEGNRIKQGFIDYIMQK